MSIELVRNGIAAATEHATTNHPIDAEQAKKIIEATGENVDRDEYQAIKSLVDGIKSNQIPADLAARNLLLGVLADHPHGGTTKGARFLEGVGGSAAVGAGVGAVFGALPGAGAGAIIGGFIGLFVGGDLANE